MAGQVCIGGPMDGQRVGVFNARSFKAAGTGEAYSSLRPGDVIYRRDTLASPPGFTVDVWVAEYLRPDEALAMLVDGYRVPR